LIDTREKKERAARLSSKPGNSSAARHSVESEFDGDSWVARVYTGDEDICALALDRRGLHWDEFSVWVWRSEMP